MNETHHTTVAACLRKGTTQSLPSNLYDNNGEFTVAGIIYVESNSADFWQAMHIDNTV